MSHLRKKPEETFIERSNREFENERTILCKQAYELGRIRGRKETIAMAREWLEKHSHWSEAFVMEEDLLKLMEK